MEESKEKGSVDKNIDERVHQQLVYKDNRIIDLNNVILDKERQILDLQERVREHNEVNTVKNQAMRIVQQKFEEMHRDKKDMSTETDHNLLGYNSPSTSSSRNVERRTRSSSPGHVIAARKPMMTTSSSGTFSPPPIDPPFESSSKLGPNLPDIDGISRKHSRKRVTFDLNPGARHHHTNPDALESALTEASSENALLRQQVYDLNAAVEKMKADYETEIVKYTKEAKTAGLKAKVVATARIKELESSLEEVNEKYEEEVERLREEVSTLRSSRNWEIEQNGQLREKIAHLKEKTHKLTDELDESEKAKRSLDHECEESKNLNELMIEDLLQAESAINFHVNQKEAIFQDVDRLKDAIVAQDRFIEILEDDIKIYEQHIGLLRESLGASKIDHRALIKSKAFETKLLALEREKEQIDKKSTEDRLKTKALDKKCRVLLEQNEQLVARLCELEMSSGGADEAKDRRLAELEEKVRQSAAALESERDAAQQLREAKEVLERELLAKTRHGEASSNRMKRDVELSKMDAQNKVEEMTVEVEAARRKASDVQAEVEQLRATNFDLQMHIETAKRTLEELATSNEELEERVHELEENMEEKDEDLKQSTWDVETLTRQNEALRVELDGIRQGFHETRELTEEVKMLKSELSRQQELHRAQFEAACEKLDQEEETARRKTSLEVQQEQYILAFEQKVEEMNEQLRESTDEKYQLQRLLEQKEHELLKMADNVTPVQRKTTSVLEAPSIEQIQKTEVQMTMAVPDSGHEIDRSLRAQSEPQTFSSSREDYSKINELKKTNEELLEKLKRVEMEANLSGELNVELGRAMLELEEQNELLRKEQDTVTAEESARGRELEMHVMLVQEMNEQIQTMQSRIDAMGKANRTESEVVERMKHEVATAHKDHQKAQDEIERLLHSLSEFELARKSDLERANAEHDGEIRAFSIRMEDARREIADLEVKLQEAKAQSQDLIQQQQQSLREAHVQEPVVLQETQILTASTPVLDIVEVPEVSRNDDEIREQNRLYRECHQDVSRFQDMSKLNELKDELEIAVQALKAEIWSLNGQLKASILDREGLEDKVAELDSMVEKEKKRAIALDVELQEQIDLTDKAVRRAAEAENESNQRMAECLEKETSREEIEKAYTRLNEYYNQLQEAYNNVYAQLAQAQAQNTVQQPTSSTTPLAAAPANPANLETPEVANIIDSIMMILLISRDPSISLSTQQKLQAVADKLKSLVAEYDENQKALDEQRRISEALELRLQTLEGERSGEDVTTTRERVQQLEGEIEWKEEECEGLKRRIKELEKALEAVAERADEEEAARLTTRQADVDSLFRTNAELAHTNVRLQNEVDEHEEWREKVVEEKAQLEQLVKDLELQVAELMEQHETHIQQEHLAQSAPSQNSGELQETQAEVQRLSDVEKMLKSHISALEEQNSELGERLQDLEEELFTVRAEKEEKSQEKKQEKDTWDDWGESSDVTAAPNQELEEAKHEVERLTGVERELTMRMEMLQIQNEQLEEKMKQKKEEVPTQATDEDWGWGDEKEKTRKEDEWGWGEEEKKEEAVESSSEYPELIEAKTEVQRLAHIEKVLNNRILALEDQNLELEERLQEMEEELATIKAEKVEKVQSSEKEVAPQESSGWDDWEEEQEKPEKPQPDDSSVIMELQQTISGLQERLKFQKEIIEKVEAELIEQQDKYDELEELMEKTNDSGKDSNQELEELKASLESVKSERDALRAQLEENEAEKERLEERVRELEETQKEENSGWNDDGWGEEKEDKNEEKDEEISKLRQIQENLNKKVRQLEQEKLEQQEDQDETLERLSEMEEAKFNVEQDLVATRKQLDELKSLLAEKEVELSAASTSEAAGWNDDSWADDGELEKMKETQKTLEKKLEVLSEELNRVKENEQRLQEENASLQSLLKSTESELKATKQKLDEAESAAWNDDDGWGNEEEKAREEEVKKALEEELQKRNVTIEKLLEQISQLQRELIEASESADLSALEELESLKEELRTVREQNGLLKDSEARLLDHADEFAVKMEEYKEKCAVLNGRVKELEEQVKKSEEVEASSEELGKLRQQLANSEQEVRARNATISDREGQIAELRLQVAEHQKTIEELRLKLKSLSTARRVNRPSTSSTTHPQVSRPSSRLSTSSRVSTSSSFVPDAHAVPLQSAGSAFDVVVPQSGEPLRRRNK